jgi:hypothetical protein
MAQRNWWPNGNAEHVFEKAGLGKAPFRLVGFEVRVGPITLENGVTVGSPGQPMGTCDYCGMGIKDCYIIQSSDGGSQFVVGSTCVGKTGDAGLKRQVNAEARRIKRERKAIKDQARIKAAREKMDDPEVEAFLRSQQSPNYKIRPADTAWDWASFMMEYAGVTGRIKVCRYMDKVFGKEVA